MNKKFKYKKSLLAAILSATLLAGCDGGGSGSSSDTPPVDSGTGSLPEVKPDPTPNPEPTPEPTPDPEPTPEPTPDPEPTPEPEPEPVPTKTGYLTLGGSQRITGATCNGESSDGFTFTPGDKVTCVAGNNTTIATFDTQSEAARSLRAVEKVSFSLEDAQELAASDDKKSNAVSLVTSSNSCPANTEQVCLTFSSVIESKRFDSLYKQIDLAPEEFKKLVNEEVENNAATDKAPSTHTSPVVPVTTPGTKPDLNASFVSANAEQFYQYQPTEIILSEGRLVDSMGNGVVGVNYYTSSGRGVTGENGKFNFSWGETISFGIDTFELGSVRGNKSTIALTELGDEVRGANIDQLIHRYSQAGKNDEREVPDVVRKVFAEYPNVINEIINLSLSNGEALSEGDQTFERTNEFLEQFESGQAKEIDTAICDSLGGCNSQRWFSLTARNVNDGQIQGVINKLWGVDTNYKSVSKFHVFHDSTNFYGSTGNARGQAVVNISNAAFPILMARNDKNYWLAFGEKRAWDKNELAYITEAPSLVEPENVTRDTATFNLPFISLGQVGEGKLMVIRRAQVHVEALIVEVAEGSNINFGVQWASKDAGLMQFANGTQIPIGTLGAAISQAKPQKGSTVISENGATTINPDTNGDLSTLAQLLSGFSGTAVGVVKGDWMALVQAVKNDSSSNVLSTPSITTLDNQEAFFMVGQDVPVLTGSTVGSNNSNPFNTVERKKVGIMLKVTPQINEGNAVQMVIEQEVSKVEGQTSLDVVFGERKLKTTVLANDGELIVLGGLMDDQAGESVAKVPLLGDIPLIGNLFKSTADKKEKRNLMVFIRPTILRDGMAADGVSQRKYNYMRAEQIYRDEQGLSLMPHTAQPVLPAQNQALPPEVRAFLNAGRTR